MKQAIPRHSSIRQTRGFTLLEVLVSMAVLAIICLIIGNVISAVTSLAASKQKRTSSEEQARFVLDRIGFDWSARTRRPELLATMNFSDLNGNSALTYYSSVNGSGAGSATSPRPISQVSYRVGSGFGLDRQASSTFWEGGAKPQFWTPLSLPTSGYETIASGVVRFSLTFQLRSGTLYGAGTPGAFISTPPADLRDVGAIIVTLAVLDESTKEKFSSHLSTLTSRLEPAPANATPMAKWTEYIASDAFRNEFPLPIVQNLRVFQRFYYAN